MCFKCGSDKVICLIETLRKLSIALWAKVVLLHDREGPRRLAVGSLTCYSSPRFLPLICCPIPAQHFLGLLAVLQTLQVPFHVWLSAMVVASAWNALSSDNCPNSFFTTPSVRTNIAFSKSPLKSLRKIVRPPCPGFQDPLTFFVFVCFHST